MNQNPGGQPTFQAGGQPAATPTQPTVPAASPATGGQVAPATAAPQLSQQTGPGTGIPNPHYTYKKKPPLLGTGLQRDILSLLIKIGVIAGIVVALFTFIFGVIQYDSPSMSPTVNSGDLILFSQFERRGYIAQDLVVVRYQGETQVRRVVATAGNTVDIVEGRLIIDGATQQEENIFTITNRYESEIDFPLTVPEGHIFVLGDHREGSTDSRIYGTVPEEDTLGKVTGLFRRRGF